MSVNKSTIKLFQFEPRPANWLGVLAVILRVAMGAWFFYAGWLKVFGGGLNQFVTDIENYRLVNENIAIAIGYFLPFLEIFTHWDE